MSSPDPSIVVLISGSGTNLQAIIDAAEAGHIPGHISAVISNKADAFGLERAANHKIPGLIADHKAFNSREAFDQHLTQMIDEFDPKLVILAGFMRILSEAFVTHYAGKLINIHPSLLPKFKGLNTHQRALDSGEQEHGCSVHFVTHELDGGPIIGQRKVAILDNDSAKLLAERVQKEEHILYPLVTKLILENRLKLEDDGLYLGQTKLPKSGIDLSRVQDWVHY